MCVITTSSSTYTELKDLLYGRRLAFQVPSVVILTGSSVWPGLDGASVCIYSLPAQLANFGEVALVTFNEVIKCITDMIMIRYVYSP